MARIDTLRNVVDEADSIRRRRDMLIRQLRHDGYTIREIADAAGMSVGGIHRIAKRQVGSIITIGYEGASVDVFVDRLVQADVQELVDVRLNAVSRRKGFSKLALREAVSEAGLVYSHRPALGNPREYRPLFQRGHLQEARRTYVSYVDRHHPDEFRRVLEHVRGRRLALMCVEADATRCHRLCITDETQALDPGIAVSHL